MMPELNEVVLGITMILSSLFPWFFRALIVWILAMNLK
jgi:hypothetical protein